MEQEVLLTDLPGISVSQEMADPVIVDEGIAPAISEEKSTGDTHLAGGRKLPKSVSKAGQEGYSIRQLPESERPRERLGRHGPDALSSAELVAIILGSGTKGRSVLQLSQELIAHFGSLERLAQATAAELRQIKGLGQAKSIQLMAVFGIANRVNQHKSPARMRVESPHQAYQLVKKELENEKRELFVVILQDIRRQVIRHEVVAVGTLSNILVHPREVFYPAIRHKATSMILVHNHPSGDPTPSPQDRHLTTVLVEAGKLIGISVTDHLIIGRDCFLSLRQEGMAFS